MTNTSFSDSDADPFGTARKTSNHHGPAAPEHRDSGRSGAMWVTGTGAFLLLAASALFVAMRWDQLADEVKLAVVCSLTGMFLLAGRSLRHSLPATATSLWHLGALLIPVDVGAVFIHLAGTGAFPWAAFLLTEGVISATAFYVLGRSTGSSVLRWAAMLAVVVAAAGAGAVISTETALEVPAPLVLVGLAAIAHLLGYSSPARLWASVAGWAPVLAAVENTTWPGQGVLDALGLVEVDPAWVPAVTGVAAALVLAREATARRDRPLAALAVGSLVVGLTVSYTGLNPNGYDHVLGIAAAFALVEASALLLGADEFWGRPAGLAASGCEVVAAFGTLLMAAMLTFTPFVAEVQSGMTGQPKSLALAAAVTSVAWAAAALRRHPLSPPPDRAPLSAAIGSSWTVSDPSSSIAVFTAAPGPFGLELAAAFVAGVTAALVGGSSLIATAVVLAVVAGVLALSRRAELAATGAGALLLAPFYALDSSWAALGMGLAMSALAVGAASMRARLSTHDPRHTAGAWFFALAGLVPLGVAAFAAHDLTEQWLALVGWTVASGGYGLLLERAAQPPRTAGLGLVGMIVPLVVLPLATTLEPLEMLVVAGAVGAVSLVAFTRSHRTLAALPLACSIPVGTAAVTELFGWRTEMSVLALAATAVLAAAVTVILPRRHGALGGVTATVALVWATALAASEIEALLDVGIAAGVSVVLFGLAQRASAAIAGGAGVATIFWWYRLAADDIHSSEPYLFPVAAILLVVGVWVRAERPEVSSWAAYGTPLVILGVSPLLERYAGGPGWHAIAAGAIGVAAVALGGLLRLAAPLLLGSAVLLAVTLMETIRYTSGVETWIWLALGGILLVAVGVIMERSDTGPVQTGRQLLKAINERFA